MGQLKFEREFSEKLNQREIAPKPSSWEALSAGLDSEEKRSSPVLWWVGIAATIIGGVLIASLVFAGDPVAESDRLVEKPSEEIFSKEQPEETLIAAEEREKQATTEKTEKLVKEKSTPVQNPGYAESSLSGSYPDRAKQKKNTLIEDIVLADEQPAQKIITSSPQEEAVAEISLAASDRGEVTNAEVDALLAEARSQISQRRDPESKVFLEKITAHELLWDVQMELEASFREKVFEVVKDGFKKARSAVANRND